MVKAIQQIKRMINVLLFEINDHLIEIKNNNSQKNKKASYSEIISLNKNQRKLI